MLRPLNEYLAPDPQHDIEVIINESTGECRSITFADWYANVSSLNLIEPVPRQIVEQFDKARNIFILSWFAFNITTTAELQAYLALEMALWTRLEIDPAAKRAPRLKALLETALKKNLLSKQDFCSAHPLGETPCRLTEAIVRQRNELSHGSEYLFGSYSVMALEICARLIQALFRSGQPELKPTR